jgi:hypothetical protein
MGSGKLRAFPCLFYLYFSAFLVCQAWSTAISLTRSHPTWLTLIVSNVTPVS